MVALFEVVATLEILLVIERGAYMLKAIVVAAILGMLLPVAGHMLGSRMSNNWYRFIISIICLIAAILIAYALAVAFNWGVC
ncbi:MAG: hypothetical protein GX949_02165 [Peptococcaceae bacterium]|nr:hypothetical protein [Peptococcaceae bacterium]